MTRSVFHRIKGWLDRQWTSPLFTARQLYSMTVPFILDSLSIMFINMLITALISSSGETSVAAVNLVTPIFSLLVCLINGIAAGGTVAVTQSFGMQDLERTKKAAGHVLWLIFLIGAMLCIPLILFPKAILSLLYRQAEPAVMEKAIRYMVPGSFSIIIFTVYTASSAFSGGWGSRKNACG